MNQTLGTNSSRKNRIQNYIAVVLFFVSFSFLSVNHVVGQFQNTIKAVTKDINVNIKGYQESLPVDYASNPNKKYPLLIFIHGKGELGNGTASQIGRVTNVGIGYNLRTGRFPASFTVNGEKFSFIVVAPQLVKADYGNSPAHISSFIEYCKKTYRVDESRIYLTGLSMGGGMTWRYGGIYAADITGIVPVCASGSQTTTRVATIAKNNLAVWATHNENDPTVGVSVTKNFISALTAYVPKMTPQPLMTIFAASGHDAWSKTYDPNFRVNGKNIYEWMLSNQRKVTGSKPSEQPPVANAGSAQTITLPTNSVTLSGSGTTPSGSITAYSWAKTSGGAASITSASAAKTTVTGLVAGTYNFTLTVTNSAGLKASSVVTITVRAAQPPVANAGSAQTITLPTNSVTLTGSGSTPSGSITAYSWAKTSGGAASITSASSAKTTVTGLVAGTYNFTLTVTNSAGLKASSAVIVTVIAAEAPTANAGSAQTITLPTNSITLDGSKSSTAAGSITKYAWVKTSGGAAKITNASAAKTTVTGLVAGTYKFTLTVTNSAGLTSSSEVTITVKPVPASTEDKTVPLPDAGSDKTITLPTNSVTLDASASTAQVGRIISYTWSKVSGGTAKIASPGAAKTSVSSLTKGTYIFSVLVTSDNGKRASADVKVIVNEAAPSNGVEDKTMPVADAGADKAITLPTNSISLDGTGSVAQAGRIISYTWSKLSGGTAKITSAGSAKTSVTGLVKGTYTFSLLVIADNGKRSTDQVKVVVNESTTSNKSAETKPLEPVANAGASKTLTLPTNSVTLDGSGSVVSAGRIISYTWTKVSGGAATIVSAGSAKTSVTGLTAGSYVFSLLVIADNGQRNTSTVSVTVNKSNASARVASATAEESTANVLELSSVNKLELSASPNPATSSVTLVMNSAAVGKTSILVYNLQGHLVMQEEFNKDNATRLSREINISKLNPGIYVINVNVGSQAKQVIRLVKQ